MEFFLVFRAQQPARNRHRFRSIQYMHHRTTITRIYFYRRMNSGSCSTTDQQRNFKSLFFHFFGHVHHFIQRRGDQTTQANDIHFVFFGCCQYFFTRNHYPDVNDFEVITSQNDAYNIFSDIMHIPFYGRHQYLSCIFSRIAIFKFFFFKEGHQIRHRFFHYPGRFHYLR